MSVVSRILRLIRQIVPSVDSVRMWFSLPLTDIEIAELKRLNHPHPVSGKADFMRFNTHWCYTVKMSCPTSAAIAWLDQRFRAHQYRVSYLEIALDYVCRTGRHAREVGRFFDMRLIKPWNRHQKVHVEGTIYIGKRRSAVTVVGYVRRSKVVRKPCFHLEYRFKRTSLCRLRITSFRDLLSLDIRAIFAKRLRLVEFDPSKLPTMGKAALARPEPRFLPSRRLKTPIDRHRRMGAAFVRRAWNDEYDTVDCQRLKELLAEMNVKNTNLAFKILDNTPFLPHGNNTCAQTFIPQANPNTSPSE